MGGPAPDTDDMRLLLQSPDAVSAAIGGELTPDALFEAYRPPVDIDRGWMRCNMVTSVDGAATGADGRSGSLNDDADHVVFEQLRAASAAVVVGAGTVRAEGYPPLTVADDLMRLRRDRGLADRLVLVVVTQHGEVPPTVQGVTDGSVLVALPRSSGLVDEARGHVGDDNVLVCGDDHVEPDELVRQLGDRGLHHLLCEGGPGLLGTLLAAGLVDELCYTIAPHVLGGDAPRTVGERGTPAELDLRLLVEQDGTVMGRWLVRR